MRKIVTVVGATLTFSGLCLIFLSDWSLMGLIVWGIGFLTMLFAPSDRNLIKLPHVRVEPTSQVSTRVRTARLELPTELDEAFQQPVAQIPDSFFSALSEARNR